MVERLLLRAMINLVPDYLFVKDRDSRFLVANPPVAGDLGLKVEDLLGKTDFDIHPKDLAQKFFDDEQAIMASGVPRPDIEEFVITAAGDQKWLLTSKLPLRDDKGTIIGLVGICRDVSERRRAELALAESESRWNFALAGAGQGVWDHDLTHGKAFFSSTWRRMRGIGPDEEIDSSREAWLARVHPDDRERLIRETNSQDAGELAQNSFEYRERHRDGHYIWILSRGKPVELNADGSVARIIGTDTDITGIKQAEARAAAQAEDTYRRHLAALQKAHEATEAAHQLAQSLARHDPLTGLPNRRVFSETLATSVARATRVNAQYAILIVDLNRFKPVNDLLGHAAGDSVLTAVAIRLAALARKIDTIARLGGDEFGIILDCTGSDDTAGSAAAFADRVGAALAEPITIGDQSVTVGASVGIVLCPMDGTHAETLLRAADMAMYQAKKNGGGSYSFFRPSMETTLRDRVALEEDVRRAVRREEILPYYQPLMKLDEDRLVGFEILARWHHAVRGDVEPDTFIPIAEKLGLIGELTYSLLRRALRDASGWPRDITLAINISAGHLTDPLLPVKLLAILTEADFSPSRLEVEITETAFVADMGAAKAALATLQSLGINICLDDFGMGYSGLYNLRELHFDKIKIDRSFVLSMQSNANSGKIVHSVLELAKKLGLPAIAEGIEGPDAVRQIMQIGGEYGQGFHFGKAMPAAKADELVNEITGVSGAHAKRA